jgi:hypothetical protein
MKKPRHRKHAKTVLRLADPEHAKSAVLNSWASPESRRSYDRIVVTRYQTQLEQLHLAPSTINQRLQEAISVLD